MELCQVLLLVPGSAQNEGFSGSVVFFFVVQSAKKEILYSLCPNKQADQKKIHHIYSLLN